MWLPVLPWDRSYRISQMCECERQPVYSWPCWETRILRLPKHLAVMVVYVPKRTWYFMSESDHAHACSLQHDSMRVHIFLKLQCVFFKYVDLLLIFWLKYISLCGANRIVYICIYLLTIVSIGFDWMIFESIFVLLWAIRLNADVYSRRTMVLVTLWGMNGTFSNWHFLFAGHFTRGSDGAL